MIFAKAGILLAHQVSIGKTVKNNILKASIFSALIMIVSACSSIPGLSGESESGSSSTMGLISALTSQLGVSNDQAMGGSGALFGMAKQALGDSDFAAISDSVPGMDSILAAAPQSSGLTEKLGGMMGGSAEKATGLASVAGSFSELGLSPEMTGKFVPVILDYVKSSGGEGVMNTLKGIWQ